MKLWSYRYTAGGLKLKVQQHTKSHFENKIGGLIMKVDLKIMDCKIEGPLYAEQLLHDYSHLSRSSNTSDTLFLRNLI